MPYFDRCLISRSPSHPVAFTVSGEEGGGKQASAFTEETDVFDRFTSCEVLFSVNNICKQLFMYKVLIIICFVYCYVLIMLFVFVFRNLIFFHRPIFLTFWSLMWPRVDLIKRSRYHQILKCKRERNKR